jgi:predicted ArsR family transcriptional regulator
VSQPNQINYQTRERILSYLQENRVVSALDLSRAWGLSRTDIRYHLNALMEEGWVEQVPQDGAKQGTRGRPKQFFRLASSETPDNLAGLSSALLSLMRSISEQGKETGLKEDLLKKIADTMRGNWYSSPSLAQRYNQAVVYLNDHGYRARWEARAAGPLLSIRNCPYASLLPNFPEMCQIDQLLIEGMVQSRMEQTSRMDLKHGKPPTCQFLAKPRPMKP